MRKLALLFTIVALAGLVAPATAAHSDSQLSHSDPVPLPENGALFGAFVKLDEHNGLERRSAMLNFEALAERQMAIDRQYYLWDEPFPTADDEWSRDMGRTLYISWNGNASTPQQGCANWADIAAGLHDADIDARAAAIKAFGAPMFFAFHHEPMTAPPPGYEVCGNSGEFIDAWRHIRSRFISQGVTNVSWSWTVTAWSFDQFEAENWYPGDDAVDIVAADGYNWYGCEHHPGPWREFNQIFQRYYDFGVEHGKPMVIAEYGTGEDDEVEGKKAQWFTNAAETVKSWPEVKGVTYFNVGSSCARYIDSSESSRAAFAAVGNDPYFNPVAVTPVEVSDFQFTPQMAKNSQGTGVQWTFEGPSDHTATDSSGMGLFDSGVQGPGSTYTFSFISAGTYRYRCSIHPTQMKGSVRVPITVDPRMGETGTEFTITWASEDAPAGYVFDAQIRRPGNPTWTDWLTGQTVNSATFVPDAGVGDYAFRSRYRNTGNGRASVYSVHTSIKVTEAPREENVGDFNGDGWPDLVVSAPEDDARDVVDGGTVNVLYGSAGGIQADDPPDQFWTQDHPDVPGEARNKDEFGRTLGTGDFNNDGYDDLAVGAIFEDVGEAPNRANDAGGFNTFYGSADGLTTDGAQFIVQDDLGGDPSETGDLFGGALHSADFNNDGYDDLAVGVWHETVGDQQFAGAMHIMFGSAAGLSTEGSQFWTQDSPGIEDQAESFDEFGRQLADADFNNDGYRDLAIGIRLETVGAQEEAGAVSVLYGSPLGLRALGDQFFTQDSPGMAGDGAEAGDWFGRPVTPGDFNADGFDDLLIGSRREDVGSTLEAGSAHVLYGSAARLTTAGSQFWTQDSPGIEDVPEQMDWFGHQAAAGDFNGDGYDDVSIGPFGESVGSLDAAGAMHVLFGSETGLSATGAQYWTQDSPGLLEESEEGDWFSFYMWSKDFNQDGYDDLAASAPGDTVGDVEEAGVFHIMFGSATGLTADGNQVWSQDSQGVTGDGAEFHDLLGGIMT